ncbi:MAG TPA: DnaB-like helicase C-terminal domain-containing protein [Acetobacteraceae bacterium]|nr:DnaB-like helicase C-terminal domain-containing protein [Acetobacteraceae bacterium]
MTATARRDDIQRHIVGPSAPAALAAERTLIGIVLQDPGALDLIDDLNPPHFYEPLHGRLWAAIRSRHAAGSIADQMLLDGQFAADESYRAAGGLMWLDNLIEVAPGASRAATYAAEIREAAQRRELLKLADKISDQVGEGESTAADVIGVAEAALLAMQVSSRVLEPVTAAFAAARVLEALDAPAEAVVGIRTGLAPLDEELGPLMGGDLILGAGRPSMGKSAAAGCIAYNIAEQGYGVIEINGEMTAEQMAQRHLSDICHHHWGSQGPEYRDMRRRNITADQRRMLGRAQEILQPLPLVMLKRAGLKLSQLRSIARRQASLWARSNIKLGALIIDHMGLVRPDANVRDRYEAQTLISNGTKELAEELDCPIFALNQMNRENEKREDKRPQLSDLRDSGSWEQDADVVIGWYREAYYAQRQAEPKGGVPGSKEDAIWADWDRARRSQVVEAIILKNRAGACSTVKLWGDVARNAIRGRAPEGDLL